MADLDYGYEITIETPGTSDPAATPTNQWQRKQSGGAWVDIAGETGETYTVAAKDRDHQVRLVQDFDGTKAFSNELSVTADELDIGDGLGGFGDLPGAYAWKSGVLAPNGKIYGIPHYSQEVLEIDPETRTTSTFGSLSAETYKWSSGVLAPDGKIYCIPESSPDILVIDPETRTTSTFPHNLAGNNYCGGGVLAPNGKIYCIPANPNPSTSLKGILEIDPVSRTTSTFGDVSGFSGYHSYPTWAGGVLAPNGYIYGIPGNGVEFLKIDPVNRTVEKTKMGSVGERKWNGGVLAPNGKIYTIPDYTNVVGEFDPETEHISTISISGKLSSYQRHFSGGALAPNGMIYAAQRDSTQSLEINPVTRTAKLFGPDYRSPNGRWPWWGTVLAPNGKLYGVPYLEHFVWELDLNLPAATGPAGQETWTMPGLPGDVPDPRSPYFNKF